MDPVQLTIIVISFILTVLVVVLSIQVWYILKEVRCSFQKMNKMLDDAGRVTGTVGESVEGLGGLVSGIRTGLSFFSSFRKKGEDDE